MNTLTSIIRIGRGAGLLLIMQWSDYASLSQPHGALDHLAQRPGVVREARTAVEPAKPADGTPP
jgi:hypothetical protein